MEDSLDDVKEEINLLTEWVTTLEVLSEIIAGATNAGGNASGALGCKRARGHRPRGPDEGGHNVG